MNKKYEDDDMLIEEKSIDNTNLINLKNSQQYYNKSKWISWICKIYIVL